MDSRPAPAPLPQALCPLCGQANQCALAIKQGESESGVIQPPCWCTQIEFSADVLRRLPPELLGRVCICAACAGAEGAKGPE